MLKQANRLLGLSTPLGVDQLVITGFSGTEATSQLFQFKLQMISDNGQIIRCPIDQISIVGRPSRGVTLFNTAEGERVVSVSRLCDVDNGDEAKDESNRLTDVAMVGNSEAAADERHAD